MATYRYHSLAAVLTALTVRTVAALNVPPEYAAARVRDFLAALTASGAVGAVYPLGPGRDVYVEVQR